MAQADDSAAGAVWLDLEREQLWRGDQARHLRPKSFALLRYLVAHPGRVLSKDELVQAVWPETAISDGVLTVSITEIRQALGDAAQAPQYLETVPRRGYRWRGALPTTAPLPAPAASPSAAPLPPPLPIGREAEVTQLHQWLAQARGGVRQVGFVTGEAGIGKTTVVDAFLAQVAQAPACGWPGGSASSRMAPAKPTCRSSRPWGSSGAGRTGPSSWPGWRSRRRPGWCRCRPSSRPTPWRRCSAACWGPPGSACCAS